MTEREAMQLMSDCWFKLRHADTAQAYDVARTDLITSAMICRMTGHEYRARVYLDALKTSALTKRPE